LTALARIGILRLMRPLVLSIIFAFAAALPVSGDPGVCATSVPVEPFTVNRSDLQRKTSMINLWWTSEERKAMTHEEAVQIRNKQIDDIYLAVESARRKAYADAGCVVESVKRCCSTPGERRTCGMTISPPQNMRFDVSTLENIDDDFDRGGAPSVQRGGDVVYVVKKTGSGCNSAGFRARAVYTDTYINAQVRAELDQVRAVVDPLVNITLDAVAH
jgi:hypothetical protein